MKPVWTGRVVAGRGVGRQLGFPTLNLAVPPGWAASPGVYAAGIQLAEQWQAAALFFGRAATFGVAASSLELHVLDWSGPAPAEVQFRVIAKVREVAKFENVKELQLQIAKDLAAVQELWTRTPLNGRTALGIRTNHQC